MPLESRSIVAKGVGDSYLSRNIQHVSRKVRFQSPLAEDSDREQQHRGAVHLQKRQLE
jgi:hypothetical protein